LKLFLDTASLFEIRHALEWSLLDSVTTNPTLISKEQKPFEELVGEICKIVKSCQPRNYAQHR
jgi:transaldolase